MEDEFEHAPMSPALKVSIGAFVAVVIMIAAQASGFVDIAAVFGGSSPVDDSSTSTVPATLAFEDETSADGGDGGVTSPDSGDGTSTRPTIVDAIELNPVATLAPTTTVPTSTTTQDDGATSTSTTPEDPGDDPESEDTIPPQFDENGDPIPVDDSEQSTENEPVRRTYNEYDAGSS